MANKKVGTKTGEKTTAGRDVYKTPEGESVSEKSVTIKFGENAYVNAPSIHEGVEYSEDEIKQMLMDGKIKPTSRHDTLEEALEAAQERSNTLMNEGGMAIEKQTKPLFSKLFRPEVNLSGETTGKNIDFGELNNEPLKAELKQKNLFGRVGFTGTTENNTSYGLGANLTSSKSTITTPKELREYGVPEKIEFGSGKLKGNSYDGFLALQDIFGVEGLEARIDAGYTPLEYEKDLKKLALNFKYKFNEGGMAIEKQMEMFEDGGLMQEGGTVDPVSGNDVPVGSTQEEVRDDIPAQLSEGEFVFPADVVRFYGLEKLMEMRQRAKAGLRMMEDMGQMGNSEEATLPDDIPFDLEDLDMEDGPEYNNTMEMQVGGFVQPQGFTGIQTIQPSVFQNYQPQYVPYQAPTVPTTYQPVQQQAVPTFTGQVPKVEDFLKTPQPGEQDLRKYVNAEGQVRMIPFVNDQPIYPIPQGFYPEAEKPIEEPAPTAVTTETTRVTDRGGRDSGDTTSGATMSFGGSQNSKGTISGAMTGNISYSGIPGGITGLLGLGPTGAAARIAGIKEPIQLSEGQTATLSNVSVSDGLSRANVLGNQSITFSADQFNTLNKASVTSKERKELEDVAREIGSVYSKLDTDLGLSYDQAKEIAQAMKDAAKEEVRYQASLKTGETFIDDEDLGNAPTNTGKSLAAARKEAADAARARYNNEVAFTPSWASGNQSARDKGIAGMRGADGFESSGRAGAEAASRDLGVGMASRGKAKGGVATKKMKRGGLASKK
jgi:hypothetical protein